MEPGSAGLHGGEVRTSLSVAVTKHKNYVGREWLESSSGETMPGRPSGRSFFARPGLERVDPAVAAAAVRVEEDPAT